MPAINLHERLRHAFRPRVPTGAFALTLALSAALSAFVADSAWAALKIWTGLGDGISWTNGANWSGGTVPLASDDVRVDNLDVENSYTIRLPAGATTVAVARLTLAPAAGKTVTVELPATNTANPGLRVGDGLAGTNDIVIGVGGTLKNSSGAAFGNGIELVSVTNGTVRIENGGRFVHNTVRSASGIAPFLSTAAGTETGEFEYDVPGNATTNIAASGRTYGSLKLSRTTGPGTYGALGSSPLVIRGALTMGAGVTFSSSMTGALSLGGNLSNGGVTLALPASQALTFNGSSPQTISGSGGIRFNGPAAIALGATVVVGATTFANENTLAVSGTLQLNQGAAPSGSGTYTYAPSGKLVFNATTGTYVVNGNYWPTVSPPLQVTVQGAGITMQASRTVSGTLGVSGTIVNADRLTLTGNVELNTGGLMPTPPMYAGEARLIYYANVQVANEWLQGTVVGSGVPKHVSIRGDVQMPPTSRTVPGDLSVEGGTLRLDPDVGEVEVFGNFTSLLSPGVEQGAVSFAGAGVQQLSGITLEYLRINKTGGAVDLMSNLTLTAPSGGSALEFNGLSDELRLNGKQLTLWASVGGQDANGRFKGASGSGLTLSGVGSMGAVRFTPGSEVLSEFTLNASGGVTLASPLTVESQLFLTLGSVTTGANVLALGSAGTVVRGSGRVIGNLKKHVSLGTSTVVWEVGTSNGYTPATVQFASVTSAGDVTATSVAGDHPAVASSGFNPSRTVNRHWFLTNQGVIFGSANATFQFLASDRDAGTDPLTYAMRRHDGTSWLATTVGTRTATTTQATALPALGAFQIGVNQALALNTLVVGGGSVTKSPNQPTYEYGTTVQLTAVANAEYHFVGWSGDASGTTNPLSVLVDGDKTITASFGLNASVLWSGAGDGTSWADPANWTTNQVPHGADEVLLDHSVVLGSYTVNLPTGNTTVTARRIGLTSKTGGTITLVVPSGNTANPGLRVGDGVASSEDLVVDGGTVLRNASGASSGYGVVLDANGILRINNGGRYVHATTLAVNGLASALLALPGTETGEFEYDVPGTASFPIAAANVIYGSLTLTRSQAATYSATGAAPLRIRSKLKLNAGVTFASTMGDTLHLGGNLDNSGALLTLPASQALSIEGAAAQSVYGSGGVRLLGPGVIGAASSLAVGATSFIVDGSLAVAGTLQLNQGSVASGTGTYSYAPSGKLVFNATSGSHVVNGGNYWPAASAPTQVVVQGAGITMQVFRTVTASLLVSAPVINADRLTLSGVVELTGSGFLSSPPTYAGEARLIYDSGGPVGSEWLEGGVVGFGVPKHVTIRPGAGAVQMPPTSRTVVGDLAVESGKLRLDLDVSEVEVRGDFTSMVTDPVEQGALNLAGSAVQQVTGPMGLALEYLRISKSAGGVELGGDLTVSAPSGGNALEFNGTSDELRLNGKHLTLSGAIGGLDNSGKLKGGSGAELTMSGSGATGTIRFAAGSEQLADLTVDASGGVSLGSALTVDSQLSLTTGALNTGTNTLTLGPAATVVRSTGRLIGNLKKHVVPGAGTVVFEVGTSSGYSPATLQFGSVTGAGDIVATAVAGDHPQVATSGLDAARTVNRHWILTNQGVSFGSVNATFDFLAADRDPGSDYAVFAARRHDGTNWSPTTTGIRTATSTQALGLSALGAFQIGDIQSYPLNTSAERNDRYEVEVDFPSAPGNRIVVNGQSNPLLENIDPQTLVGRTLTVYRDGHVALTAGDQDAARAPGVEGGGASGVRLASSVPIATQQLHAAFALSSAAFANYVDGTFMPAWADYDQDGDLDLPLYRNDGNDTFAEIPGFRALLANGNYHGSSWCDYDQDGDLDLVVMGYNFDNTTSHRTLVLRNDGPSGFVNVAASLGFNQKGRGETAVWGDFDGDGKPDLFAPYHAHQIPGFLDSSFYYRNNGGGSFTDRSFASGLSMSTSPVPLKPEGADAVDWDNDGDLDIYSASHLFSNNGNAVFTDVLQPSGLPVNFDEGSCWVDYDNDGDFDLYTKNSDTAHLFRNDAGTFVDVTQTAGLTTNSFLWGDSWADVDNDGDLDLLQYLRNASGRLLVNQGDGTFLEDPAVTALDLRGGSSSWGDYDNDGDLDLLDGSSQDFPYKLYKNQLQAQSGFDGSYLRVRVLDAAGRETQHRATVRLRSINGPPGVTPARAVGGGTTYLSQNEYTVQFGLGVRGTVARSPDLQTYESGTLVQLTANPATGFHFTSWTGDTTATSNPISVTVDHARNIRAVFDINSYAVNAVSLGGGSVSKSPNQAIYLFGSRVVLTATPSAGYHFVSWGGDASGSSNPLTITVDADENITATFAINEYPLTVTAAGNGSVAKSPDLATYPHGSSVQITATPATHYHFTGWSGNASGSTNPLAVTMNGPMSITAGFAIDVFPVNVTVTGPGTVVRAPNQATYDYGSTVQLNAAPSVNAHFVSWGGDASGTSSPVSLTVDAAKNVTATFALDTHVLQVTTVGNGTVAKSPDLAAYDHGTTVTLTATPSVGQSFVGWSGDATGSTNPLAVTMSADKNIVATFTYSLTTATQGTGSVTRAPNQNGFAPGSTVQLTAVPGIGFAFSQWSGDATGATNPLSLLMDGNKSVTATFVVSQFTLTTSTSGGTGSVTKVPNQAGYNAGSTVTLTAVPGTGYHFVSWSGDATGSSNPLSLLMDANKNVTANFAINTYTLTLLTTGNGTAAKNPNQATYNHGAIVTITATEGSGYRFLNWSGDTSATTNPLSVAMIANKSITANFGPRPPKTWVGASGGGDGSNWSDPKNWNESASPSATDSVLLDHATVVSTYTVNLPTGAVTVAVARITIAPGVGNPITMVLPAGNTANPGLRVGDGLANTDDVILWSGATLRNASGAAAGTGVELLSTANGVVRIDTGGKYVHATLRASTAIASRLSTVAGTERGEFEYDVPNTGSFAIASSGITYGSLTLTRTAGTATYTAAGASAMIVRGHLKMNAGVTYSSAMTGAMTLNGDLTNNGQNLTIPATQTMTFDGATVQHVTGTATITIGGTSTVTAPSTLAIATSSFAVAGIMTINGTLQLDQGAAPTGNALYSYNATTGTLLFNNTANLSVAGTTYWGSANSPPNVTVVGAGGITMTVNRTVTGLMQASAPVRTGNRLTLSGTNRLNPGGSWPTAPVYSGTATLLYAMAGAVGPEWSSGTAVGSGVPKNVTVQSPGTLTLPTSDRNVPGNLALDSGTLAFQSGGDVLVEGNLTLTGTVQQNGRSFLLDGSTVQTVSGANPVVLDALYLNKTAGSVQLLTDLTLNGATGVNSIEFQGTGETLDLNSRMLTLAGSQGGSDATSTIKGGGTSVLVVNGTGQFGTVRFTSGSRTLQRFTVNRTGSGGVTLGTALTVNSTLELLNGSLASGANLLTLSTGATLTRTNGFVSGLFRKTVPTGAAALTFELGSGTTYAPLSVAFNSVTTSGTLTASTAAGDHPNIGTSGLDPAKTVNRNWTLTNTGTVFDRYDAMLNFAASDIDSGVNTTNLQPRKYEAPNWLVLSRGTHNGTSVQALALTTFGDFQVGEIQTFTLDVTSVGNGSVTKNPNQPVYDIGTSVVLTANPNPGHAFVAWSGSATGTTNPLTVVMNSNKTITASFTYALDVTVVGNGSVAKSPNQANYNPGAVVNLTATPSTGYHFVSWSGDASGSTNPLPVTMNGNKAITATFAINTYTLALSSVGNGSAAKSPDLATYNHGATVTLTATPTSGHAFVAWSGSASGSTNPLTITMDADKTITASFTWALDVTSAGNGSVAKSPNQANYAPGTVVNLTATPATGYHFVSWSGDASGSTNPLPVTMNGNKAITATFAISTYTLAVTTAGSGVVIKIPNQATYNHGTGVQLMAAPATGWHFVSWSGDTSATSSPLSLTMTRNRAITANFAINTYTLAVTAIGSGSVVKNPDQATYNHGSSVTLNATPATGWHFVSWSGDASGSTNPLAVTMDADKDISATFAIDAHTLAVTTTGSGSVAKNPNQASYAYGTVVQLTATPAANWHFVGWSGAASGAANPISVTMDADKSVTATFAIDTHTVAIGTTGSGSVTKNPDQPSYAHGASVQLTAVPATGWHFAAWDLDVGGTTSPVTVTVDADLTIQAIFAINDYALNVTTSGSGSVTKSPNQARYDYGTLVQITAVPAAGWHFVRWDSAASGSANPLAVTVQSDLSILAVFAINTYTLSVTPVGNGSVAASPNQASYAHGSSVTLTAAPLAGHTFLGWSGDASGSTNPLTLTMTANRVITARFTWAVDVTLAGNGTVTKNPDQSGYAPGTAVVLTAQPAVGSTFGGWSGDTTVSNNPITVTVYGNRAVTANFPVNQYTLDASSAGHGTVTRVPNQATYTHGTVVSVSAAPDPGYHLVGWSGDATGTTSPVSITMTGPKAVVATFAINTYALDVVATGNGSVTRNPDQPLYDHGTVVSVAAVAAVGWHFTGWSGNASGTVTPVNVTMLAPRSVTAAFAIDTYTLVVSVTGSGTVAKSPNQATYDFGTPVTLTATPAAGWHFVSWSGDASGTQNPVTITMSANKNVTANFAINTYALDVQVEGLGTVSRNPNQALYNHGTVVQLTATPQAGWHLVDWTGAASGSANPLLVTMDGAKSVTARFAIDVYPLGVAVVGNGSVAKNPNLASYDSGTVVTLTATPQAGQSFLGWSGDLGGVTNPITITMDGPKNVTATFTYSLAVTVAGSGTLTTAPNQTAFAPGTHVLLTATPAANWHFVGWSGDASGASSPFDLAMSANRSVTATFAIDQHALDLGVHGNGAVTKNPDHPLYDHGSVVQLTAVASPGWHFVEWDGNVSDVSNPITVTMNSDLGIDANFEINTYTVSVTSLGHGTVAKSPNLAFHPSGALVTVTATADSGYQFAGWSGDTTAGSNPMTLTITRDRTLVASFLDTQVPGVRVMAPNGGESSAIGATLAIGWQNWDNRGVASVDVKLSRNGKAGPFETLALAQAPDGSFDWVVTGPVTSTALVVITARDSAGNAASDTSDAVFTIFGGALDAPGARVTEFALAAPVPNPARGAVTIEYSVAAECVVTLTVVDVQGRQVATLAEGMRRAGRYRVTWNAKAGTAGTPGTYFLHYRAGGRNLVRRVTVTR